jgi:hypothetical protein
VLPDFWKFGVAVYGERRGEGGKGERGERREESGERFLPVQSSYAQGRRLTESSDIYVSRRIK